MRGILRPCALTDTGPEWQTPHFWICFASCIAMFVMSTTAESWVTYEAARAQYYYGPQGGGGFTATLEKMTWSWPTFLGMFVAVIVVALASFQYVLYYCYLLSGSPRGGFWDERDTMNARHSAKRGILYD